MQVYSEEVVCKCVSSLSAGKKSVGFYGPPCLPLEMAVPVQSCSLIGPESLQSAPNVNLNLGLVTERHVINKQDSV